jgi:hypothetical protein
MSLGSLPSGGGRDFFLWGPPDCRLHLTNGRPPEGLWQGQDVFASVYRCGDSGKPVPVKLAEVSPEIATTSCFYWHLRSNSCG